MSTVHAAQDPNYDRWRIDLDVLQADLSEIAYARLVWREENKVLAANKEIPPSAIFDIRARNYAVAQSVGVRRLTDTDRRTVSLVNLLRDIEQNPASLSRERYVSYFDPAHESLGHSDFDEWACADGTHIEPHLVKDDRERLTAAAAGSIKPYVNKFIAHNDRDKAIVRVPKFGELEFAIDVLFEVFRKYHTMLTASTLHSLEPVPQYDVLGPYRVPWINPTEP